MYCIVLSTAFATAGLNIKDKTSTALKPKKKKESYNYCSNEKYFIYISIQDCEATSRRIKDKGETERVFGNMGPFPERERERDY